MESRNLTLSFPTELLERARKEARSIGVSLSEYIRRVVARSVNIEPPSDKTSQLMQAFDSLESKESKRPYKWKREDAYEDA